MSESNNEHTRISTRKIIQVSTSQSSEDIDRIALCSDGSVWEYQWPKAIWKDVPDPNVNIMRRERDGNTPATWVRLADIPQE